MYHIEDDTRLDDILTNRQKSRKPKHGLIWCSGCDCNLVPQWKKCEVCGTRNGNKRDKK